MRKYTIKFGKHFRREDGKIKRYVVGDVIELTEENAEKIKDKLVLDVAPAPKVVSEPEVEPEAEDEEEE